MHASNLSRLKRILEEVDRTWEMKPLTDQFAKEVVLRVTIPDGTPLSGEFRGKEAVTGYFTQILPEVAVFKQQAPVEFVPDGERVIVLGDDAYTLKKTGETFRSPYAMVVGFEEEQIKSILIIQDLSGLAAAYRSPAAGHSAAPSAG
ncbi:nuclear transport factor 2 family protein [Hyalangium rubrum]|uniref:SnoaL-like domain-containing protein n=1 Tax=Hyalangium rubrum TaxID=3103134 RepID=A0ABU5H3A6_9BACT|nr:nuclear transport factor 2 family protein [Hyalangium sp. s54d21]MDY7227384.1 hypothetical protein [Hyalangium sp. s54d21]